MSDVHDASYYGKCMIGGIFACGITHAAVCPLDIVKCRRQVSLKRVYRDDVRINQLFSHKLKDTSFQYAKYVLFCPRLPPSFTAPSEMDSKRSTPLKA